MLPPQRTPPPPPGTDLDVVAALVDLDLGEGAADDEAEE
jgi:hypothetical protein